MHDTKVFDSSCINIYHLKHMQKLYAAYDKELKLENLTLQRHKYLNFVPISIGPFSLHIKQPLFNTLTQITKPRTVK